MISLTATDAFAMTRPDKQVTLPKTLLDPEFAKDLILTANQYAVAMYEADNAQWNIARMTRENWDEHKSIFPTVMEYYAECSRVANMAYKVKLFGESGETLKRWVQVYAHYENDPKADDYLDKTCFDAMYKASKLVKDGRVNSTHKALDWMIENKASADDMVYHFDPTTPPDDYDVMMGRIDVLQSEESWKPLKSKESKKQVLAHVAEIRRIVESEFPKVTK